MYAFMSIVLQKIIAALFVGIIAGAILGLIVFAVLNKEFTGEQPKKVMRLEWTGNEQVNPYKTYLKHEYESSDNKGITVPIYYKKLSVPGRIISMRCFVNEHKSISEHNLSEAFEGPVDCYVEYVKEEEDG